MTGTDVYAHIRGKKPEEKTSAYVSKIGNE